MSESVKQFPGRGALGDGEFQAALKWWREFAHRRGLVVASPIRLVGAERTLYGDSDDAGTGPKDYRLVNVGGLGWSVDGLKMSKKERDELDEIGSILDDRADYDIKDVRAPTDEAVETHDEERDRWEIWASEKRRIGTVVRVGDGSQKHYLLYLWFGGWIRVTGSPPFDIPMFGSVDLRERPDAPVMIHEGPKSWRGAVAASDGRVSTGRLANWMGLYCHVGWHGSDIGMAWTDWSGLRGRKVIIWPDMDEAGLLNARRLAARLSRMGGVIEYVNWSRGDIAKNETWDWGDPLPPALDGLTRTEVRRRLMKVESPLDEAGHVSEEWARRSFFDLSRKEVYQISTGYRPESLDGLAVRYGKGFQQKIAQSEVNPFMGTDYRPGIEYGRMDTGKINVCPPHMREPMSSKPLEKEVYREILQGWLARMIPDPVQRKHLLRRAAWAVARPHKVSGHMTIMQGESGIGKSVFLDTIVRVAGEDRASSMFPDSILTKFNGGIAYKSVICIHEIHGSDLTRKQNAERLKELIANETVETEEKNRPRVSHSNVIHWFSATNERVPFTLEHGNDRFYFIRCESPRTPREIRRKERFFTKWVPKFKDPVFLDELYAAAKWLAGSIRPDRVAEMTGRARRQKVWATLEKMSLRPWEQFLQIVLRGLVESVDDDATHPPVFAGADVKRLVMEKYRSVGVFDIERRMGEFGFCVLRDSGTGGAVRRRISGKKEVLWCAKSHLGTLQRRGADWASLKLSTIGGD